MNEEDLQLIEAMAGVFMTNTEIAEVLGVDENVLDEEEPKRRIRKGQLLSEMKIRKSVFDMAARGSSPAQNEALKMIREFNLKQFK